MQQIIYIDEIINIDRLGFCGYNKYQKGGILMSLEEKLKNLPNGVLSTSDLNKNNLKNYEISRLCKDESLKESAMVITIVVH